MLLQTILSLSIFLLKVQSTLIECHLILICYFCFIYDVGITEEGFESKIFFLLLVIAGFYWAVFLGEEELPVGFYCTQQVLHILVLWRLHYLWEQQQKCGVLKWYFSRMPAFPWGWEGTRRVGAAASLLVIFLYFYQCLGI